MTGRRMLFLALLVVFLSACAGPPALTPASKKSPCSLRFFMEGDWQFLHRLSFVVSGRRAPSLLGVTVVSSHRRSLKTALMTAEGVVLFEAESGDAALVRKSLPPFDRPGFAEGLMADVRMLFLPPAGAPSAAGIAPDGALVCRYRGPDGEILDTVVTASGRREIHRYDADGRRIRTAVLESGAPAAGRMVLTASGGADYRIEMEAVEAVRVDRKCLK